MPDDFFEQDIDSILADFYAEAESVQDVPVDETSTYYSTPRNKPERSSKPPVLPDATAVFTPSQEKTAPEPDTEVVRVYQPEKKLPHKTGKVLVSSIQKAENNIHSDERRLEETNSGSIRNLFVSLVGFVLTILCLAFSLVFIHPASGSSASKSAEKTADFSGTINNFAQSAKISALSSVPVPDTSSLQELSVVPETVPAVPEKVRYYIPESDIVAPVPDPACYGSVMPENASEIMNVIQQAKDSGLLDGQEILFRPDLDFRSDTAIRYYVDDSLLVLCWKEIIDGNTCSCVEVKMADASQFRRKFADDAFGSSNTYYATDLSKSVNAVVSMNADYYLFRDFGIVVFNRELYRFNESVYTGEYKKYNCVDTCFINENGDLLYFKHGQTTTEDELRQYIQDNNILFSIAFGPILVENSEAVHTDWYPVGDIDKGYSRAGIGEVDKLHYFYMSLNHSNEKQARWDINTFAQHFAEKGVQTAYALDGGQTSEIVFQGEPYNYIDFGAERLVSDIIYFASAISSGEVTG